MSIDWASFSPGSALAGGAIIGAAAVMFALFNGRVAGVSGILGGLLRPARGDVAWRVAFLAGLVLAPVAYGRVAAVPDLVIDAGYPVLLVAGVLVGLGTRACAGCTSGHGVCGLSRLSLRSMVATLVFMAAGVATVFGVRHFGVS